MGPCLSNAAAHARWAHRRQRLVAVRIEQCEQQTEEELDVAHFWNTWSVDRRIALVVFTGLLALPLASVLAATSETAVSENTAPESAISSYVAAGEFGPALRVARGIADADLRDQTLGRIAVAQASIGARQASLATLLDVQSDLARSRITSEMGERPIGAGGGAALADFDTLIELITSTIAPDTWDEVGGAGAIESFPTGVYVDTSGVMKRLGRRRHSELLRSTRAKAMADSGNREVRLTSRMRKVSLVRLERQLQLLKAFGKSPDEAMRVLGGIYRVKHLFVYPETGDIVLAGPAGDWRTDSEGRVVNVETGTPVLQLDDLVVLLRNAYDQHGRMGCAIKPRQENLAGAKAFIDSWNGKALRPNRRDRWIADLRNTLGKQDIEVWGIDSRTHAARILIEADYHMKLIGIGIEEGTLGVVSYLDALKQSAGNRDLPMSVLRWWFTLNYDGIRTTARRDAYEFDGVGVRVLSENEMLTQKGDRIHTGKSNLLNTEFAHSFTKHFDTLAAKYPVYAELRNVFDLALVCGIMRSEDLPAQVNWHRTHFGDANAYQVALGPAPRAVESIVNAVDVSAKRFVVGVSGGVSVDTNSLVSTQAIKVDDYGIMDADHGAAAPDLATLPRDAWWWD